MSTTCRKETCFPHAIVRGHRNLPFLEKKKKSFSQWVWKRLWHFTQWKSQKFLSTCIVLCVWQFLLQKIASSPNRTGLMKQYRIGEHEKSRIHRDKDGAHAYCLKIQMSLITDWLLYGELWKIHQQILHNYWNRFWHLGPFNWYTATSVICQRPSVAHCMLSRLVWHPRQCPSLRDTPSW